MKPTIIPRSEHTLSRKGINPNALKVLYRLHEAGFEAYLVGGGVRDLLLGLHPKDFDVATNAHPEQVRKIFSNSRLIGRRFRIVHVFFGREIIEVSTFRKNAPVDHDDHKQSEHGVILRDNVYGTIEEDAIRRDFTVNALYYNIADFSVVDFVGGMKDLQARKMHLIGDAAIRFREDPVRMMRALRLAGKLNFSLDSHIEEALPQMKSLMEHVSSARLFDELIKIIVCGKSAKIFELMIQHDFMDELLPGILKLWSENPIAEQFTKQALINTDQRIAQDKSINPAFMIAVIYWPIVTKQHAALIAKGQKPSLAFESAMHLALQACLNALSVPRRLTGIVREIWHLQRRFQGRNNKRLLEIPELQRFRAAYDFLLLRAEIEPQLKPLADWWTAFYESDPAARIGLLKSMPKAIKVTAL